MDKKNPVVHFEMGVFDRERAKKFYSTIFGWEMQQYGPDMGNYVVAQTTNTDKDGMVKTPGAINGGFYQKTDDPGSHPPSIVIAVEDIAAKMKEVVKNGGKIAGGVNSKGEKTMEPEMIPGVGLWISAIDTEGNRFSMMQPVRK